jgi:alpha-amylase
MPDLALTQPDVTAALEAIAGSWLAAGVDGYRLDAVKHYVEEGSEQENTPATFAWARDFRTAVKTVSPEALLVGEIWDASVTVARYVTEGAVDVAFEFELADAMVRAADLEDTAPIAALREQLLDLYPPGTYAAFLTNHDQNRVASELRSDPGALRVAASLLLTDPGVPFVYYGEEIGLTGRKPDERIRTPMPWDPEAPGNGFTSGEPWQAFGDDPPGTSVAAQVDDAGSLLAHYRALIDLRSAEAALRVGSTIPLQASSSAVSAVIRSTPTETLLVMVNLSGAPVADVGLSLDSGLPCGPGTPEVIFTDGWGAGAAPTQATPPLLTLTGGLEGWVPLAELPARSTVVLRLDS